MALAQDLAEEDEPKIRTILVVDDDAGIREFLDLALTMETPHHMLLAKDGFQALEMVKTSVPDLLILDYQLPKMNGLELYDRLHAREELKKSAAVLVSANLPMAEIEKRQVYHLKKPFSLDELLGMVEQLLAI